MTPDRLPGDGQLSIVAACLYLLPVQARMPLKFGAETLTQVTCARVSLTIADKSGVQATGWGETPLSAAWVWPGPLSYREREVALIEFCKVLATEWLSTNRFNDPLELGALFLDEILPRLLEQYNLRFPVDRRLPLLAGLVCASPFDLALHDAFGRLLNRPIYSL
ncbi:MAG TPA: hypothetical protein VGS41_12635, partial [Chthonomonadales bacterium]|nr:hypothetical protein [Chthonomonadales bacterium]